MGFGIVEDRPTPPQVYNWRIYAFAIVASFGAFTFGYDGSFFGTTLARKSFQEHFGFTTMTSLEKTKNTANITASYLVAGFFGSLFSWPMSETFGRVWAMRATSAVFILGATLMTATVHSLDMIYAGRVLTGLGVGALTGIIPSYIAEVAPTAIRGQLTGYFDVAYQIGSLVGFWINYGINHTLPVHQSITFRIPMAMQLVPGGMLAIGTLFLRESPALLFRHGKDDQAMENLCYLRQLPEDHQYILEEVAMFRARLAEESRLSGGQRGWLALLKGSKKELMSPSIRYRLLVTLGIFLFQNWSGSLAINYYSPTLFASLHISDVALYSGIYGICRSSAAILFYGFLIDRTGRRKPWLLSATACSLCLLYIGIYTSIPSTGKPSDGPAGRSATAMIMLYGVFWSFGGNGIPWVVVAEIFPVGLRPITGAYGASLQWLWSFVLTEVFPYMIKSPMGANGVFFFFSAMCAATAIFTYIWVPETKAVPIESMEQLWTGAMKHHAWRSVKLFPPHGIPPIGANIAHIREAFVESHGTLDKKEDQQVEEV